MAFPKIEEVRKLSDSELADEIVATKKKLFQLRLQQATRSLTKPHEFKHTKHRLGQMLTVERERQLGKTPTAQKEQPAETEE